ncbi:MAG: ethanolamine ammonia-lyase subunit EutC [Corynebacterium sp.]|nr:ethanolamine ammonia-lyase subunit EutC [Corynebacterium sp.]
MGALVPSSTTSIATIQEDSPARIALGKSGNALPVKARAELATDHAQARDAVHAEVDIARIQEQLHAAGWSDMTVVDSQATTREEYLTRPDLGRLPAHLPPELKDSHAATIGVLLIDGLSPTAVMDHGVATIQALKETLPKNLTMAPPIIVRQGRVALGDHIAALCGWDVCIVLIGERPGLSVPSSLGMYLTWKAIPGTTDERRNCISNIHPPEGTSYKEAALVAADLIAQFTEKSTSGYMIKAADAQRLLEELESNSAQALN